MNGTEKTPYNHTHGYLTKRPRILHVLCIKNFIWTIIGFSGVLAPSVKHAGIFYPPLLGLVISLQFIALIGIWNLKRWGVHLFTYTTISNIMLQLLLDRFSSIDLLFAVLMISTSLFFYKKMDKNL